MQNGAKGMVGRRGAKEQVGPAGWGVRRLRQRACSPKASMSDLDWRWSRWVSSALDCMEWRRASKLPTSPVREAVRDDERPPTAAEREETCGINGTMVQCVGGREGPRCRDEGNRVSAWHQDGGGGVAPAR